MNVAVLGSGMMGRAIAFDLEKFSNFEKITVADQDKASIESCKKFLEGKEINFLKINVENSKEIKEFFIKNNVVISAIPYRYNFDLAKLAIDTKTHFLDLGGNNTIVEKERSLSNTAKKNNVIIIPDCGLAPGLTSIITKDIVEQFDEIEYVKLRVGGLPVDPKPPLNYQIVFSPYGLINEYVEDAIVLDNGKIITKKSMEEIEKISFPSPFNEMEAFLTSGGCSTLPYTYKDKIGYLDYKTIRYPGHCEKFKTMLDLGFADEKNLKMGDQKIAPRDFFAKLLLEKLPKNNKDVVLLKVIGSGISNGKKTDIDYTMLDYYDEENNITSMMRTTGYPVSITAQMIEKEIIKDKGTFCSEEIVPCKEFFDELKKRGIIIKKKIS